MRAKGCLPSLRVRRRSPPAETGSTDKQVPLGAAAEYDDKNVPGVVHQCQMLCDFDVVCVVLHFVMKV